MKITESQIQILEALAEFKFLTTEQMIDIGICQHKRTAYFLLKPLRERHKPLIGRISLHQWIGQARLHDLFYLTKYGASFLDEQRIMPLEKIRYPVGTPTVVTRDYKHRVATINIHIAISRYVKKNFDHMITVSSYFDQKGSNRSGDTIITNKIPINGFQYIYPDLITHSQHGEASHLFVWEQHNGKDTGRLIEQVERHIACIKEWWVSKAFGMQRKLHRVGIIFEHHSILEATMQRLNQKYGERDELYRFFIFKHQNDLNAFYGHWHLWNGKWRVYWSNRGSMKERNYSKDLSYFESFNISEAEKIAHIKKVYQLLYRLFEQFIKEQSS